VDDLVRRAVAGDANALDALCRELEAPVFGLCLRMLGSLDDAKDATQEILVKVVTHLSDFEGRSSVKTWAHRIAVRHVLAMRATKAETRAVPIEQFGDLIDRGLAFGATAPPPGPDERALAREVRLSCTQGMLLALDRDQRIAVVLIDILGLDAAEAAEVVEVSHEAMRKRLSRAHQRLEAFMKAKCGVADPDAPCRCERQVAGKRAVGLPPEHARLERLVPGVDVVTAAAELRDVRQVLVVDGQLVPPPSIRERLKAHLPTLLR
jgi:RNA polymerase sigma factor (sigma-70 family)